MKADLGALLLGVVAGYALARWVDGQLGELDEPTLWWPGEPAEA